MAIRPTDLQNSIVQAVQSPPLAQRAEEAPRQAQMAAQAAFVNETSKRNESIAEAGQAEGNRVGDREASREQPQGQRRERQPGGPFEEVVEEAAGLGEPAHLIDFTA